MRIKKVPFVLSFALASLLVVSTTSFAQETNNTGMNNMMNGNGMSNMMEAMHSPEGQEMMESCSDFMESYNDESNEK